MELVLPPDDDGIQISEMMGVWLRSCWGLQEPVFLLLLCPRVGGKFRKGGQVLFASCCFNTSPGATYAAAAAVRGGGGGGGQRFR